VSGWQGQIGRKTVGADMVQILYQNTLSGAFGEMASTTMRGTVRSIGERDFFGAT
jgi:hypothetical protein